MVREGKKGAREEVKIEEKTGEALVSLLKKKKKKKKGSEKWFQIPAKIERNTWDGAFLERAWELSLPCSGRIKKVFF